MKPRVSTSSGFSLIELMVSVTLFSVIMIIAIGSLLSIVQANRKARSLQSVMNNLNVSLDGMVRSLRMGSEYDCASSAQASYDTPTDCPTGGSIVGFVPFGGDLGSPSGRWVYAFVPSTASTPGYIAKSTDSGSTFLKITAPEVDITSVKFYVVGTTPRDTEQPKIVIVVKGTAGVTEKTKSEFYIQATAVQRTLDL